MKKVLFFSIFALVLVVLSSCGGNEKKFTARMPLGTEPKIVWIHSQDEYYYPVAIVKLVNGKDTLLAHFDPDVSFPGRRYVLYRNTYPLAKNKIVEVEGYFDEAGIPQINSASIGK